MFRIPRVSPGLLLLVSIASLTAAPDPAHFYDFEGNLQDSVGNADGTYVNFGAPNYTSGVIGANALELDGLDDYIALPVTYSSNTLQGVSVSAWIKTTNSANQIIVSADRNEYWRLEINGSGAAGGGGPGRIGWDVMTNNGQVDFGGPTLVDDGNWHHVVGTFDGATGTMRIYVDGYLDAENVDAARTAYGTGNDRYSFIGRGSEAPTFGGATGPDDEFDGEIDGVRIYDVALTPQDVQELCLVGRGAINLLDLSVSSYSGAEDQGTATLTTNGNGVADGKGIRLNGNAWKKVPWQYTVTPNTILEFEIDHTGGELIGVALEEDDDHTQLVSLMTSPSPRVLVVSGTETPGADFIDSPHKYTGPGSQRIQVCIGKYFQGPTEYLSFVLDDDNGLGAVATFRNVRVFEADSYDAWALELPISERGPLDDPNKDG
ncbi:LamG domain-containing protein, partial [Arenicella sp.]|nr:LamG domain-containing protein [Arenicella sp.]